MLAVESPASCYSFSAFGAPFCERFVAFRGTNTGFYIFRASCSHKCCEVRVLFILQGVYWLLPLQLGVLFYIKDHLNSSLGGCLCHPSLLHVQLPAHPLPFLPPNILILINLCYIWRLSAISQCNHLTVIALPTGIQTFFEGCSGARDFQELASSDNDAITILRIF